MKEAKEEFGKMLRWTEQPKNAEQGEKTLFLGTTVRGIYTGKREGVGQNGSVVYELRLPDGQLVSFWGSGLLDGKFKVIPINSEVQVEYLGIAKAKTAAGRDYQNFKVMYDDTPRPAQMREAAGDAEINASAGQAMTAPASAPLPDDGY